jgi:hypothetical protein
LLSTKIAAFGDGSIFSLQRLYFLLHWMQLKEENEEKYCKLPSLLDFARFVKKREGILNN